jgi:hypothetical protein
MTAVRFSRTPLGLPGRLTINVVPTLPATARLSAAIGVCASPAARISSAKPPRSMTSFVAGRDVARPEPGAPGRHHQAVVHGLLAQRSFDLRPLVGHDDPIVHIERGPEDLLGCLARLVLARAVGDTVRDRDHGGAARSLDHGPILPSPSDADVLPCATPTAPPTTIEEDR